MNYDVITVNLHSKSISFQMVETGKCSQVAVCFQKHTADTRWKDFNISQR